jgi:hypothetical protein
MRHRTPFVALAALVAVLVVSAEARAGSHLWRFNEVFSNADGTIQFIEMRECCGAANETFLDDKWIRSDNTGVQYTFTENLPCIDCTANEHLLFATAAFAALPGAPAPDYIIPNNFLATGGNTLRYWFYTDAVWTFGPIPTDGVNSMARNGAIAVNSPTNFDGESGSVTIPCSPADFDNSGDVDVTDLLELLSHWGRCPGCPTDITGDSDVAVADLLALLAEWGDC